MRQLAVLVLAGAASAAAAVSQYTVETAAGVGRPDAPPGALGTLGTLKGIATDRWGHVFVSDPDHHRVCRVDPDGSVWTVAGTGYAGFSGDGGPAAAAQLHFPYGLAADAAGNLYIADFGNDRVRRVSLDGAITTVAGSGRHGYTGDGGSALSADLMGPRNVAVDASGGLYISEFSAHRVRRVAADGRIATVAGMGIEGYSGDGGPAASSQVAYPAGLALDTAGNLYVADSQNLAIRRVTPGGVISTVLRVSGTTAPAPVGLATEPGGALVFTDANPKLRRLLPGGAVAVVAGTGEPGYGGDGGATALAQLHAPQDVTADAFGNLYLADGERVRKILPAGVIFRLGGDAAPFPSEPAAAALAHLNGPTALALDASGNLYVAETGTHRVRRISPTGLIFPVSGDGTAGASADDIPALYARLRAPGGLAFDGMRNLLLADTGNQRVLRMQPDGGMATASTAVSEPSGMAAGPAGAVFIADTGHHRVLRLGADGVLTVAAGTGEAGDSGDGGPAWFACLRRPTAVAADDSGAVYVADTGNRRLRKIEPDGSIHAIASTIEFDEPAALAVDPDGTLFVADKGRHRVQAVSPEGAVTAVAGTGEAGFDGDGGPALSARFNAPAGLALGADGTLWVADSGNHRIRRLIPQAVPPPEPVVQTKVVSAASLQAGSVAPGEVVSLFAAGLAPSGDTGGVAVRFDGETAPLFYVSQSQINAQVPYSVAERASTAVEVWDRDRLRARASLPVAAAAPALFAAALNQDGSVNSAANPAARGSVVVLFATGEGQTNPPGITGQAAVDSLPVPILPVSLTLAGVPAELLYAGAAPGLTGILQINARVPDGFAPAGALPAVLRVGDVASPPITIFVR